MVTMASEVEQVQRFKSFRVKRTEAVPKHSLSGTALAYKVLEDKEELKSIDTNIDVDKPFKRKYGYNTLPEPLKSKLPGNAVLEQSKEKANKQKEQTTRAKDFLQSIEERAKYFASPVEPSEGRNQSGAGSVARRPLWLSDKDVENAEQVNSVGLNGHSYNHQKYGHKPPVHQYSLIGDIFRGGEMDFPHHSNDKLSGELPQHRGKKQQNLNISITTSDKDDAKKSPHCAIYLPPNIRHKFGSRICDNLLCDPERVQSSMDHQRKLKAGVKRSQTEFPIVRSVSPNKVNPVYEALGNALRQDIFPGHTYGHKISLAKSTYTDDVHKRRYPEPEQYRYQRDALSTWAEHNVLRERMKRAWAEYYQKPKSDS